MTVHVQVWGFTTTPLSATTATAGTPGSVSGPTRAACLPTAGSVTVTLVAVAARSHERPDACTHRYGRRPQLTTDVSECMVEAI